MTSPRNTDLPPELRAMNAAMDAVFGAINAAPQASADPARSSQQTTETDSDRIRRAFPNGVKERGRGDEPAVAAHAPFAQKFTCKTCHDTGEIGVQTQHLGPDDYTQTIACPDCSRPAGSDGVVERGPVRSTKAGGGPWQLHYKGAGGWVFAHPKFGHLDARSIGTDKDAAHEILAALNAYPQLVAALRELHAIDERKLAATEKRPYAIGVSVIRERVERNRALLISLGKSS